MEASDDFKVKGEYETDEEKEQKQVKYAWEKKGPDSLKDGYWNSKLTCHIDGVLYIRRQAVPIHPSSHACIPPFF